MKITSKEQAEAHATFGTILAQCWDAHLACVALDSCVYTFDYSKPWVVEAPAWYVSEMSKRESCYSVRRTHVALTIKAELSRRDAFEIEVLNRRGNVYVNLTGMRNYP